MQDLMSAGTKKNTIVLIKYSSWEKIVQTKKIRLVLSPYTYIEIGTG